MVLSNDIRYTLVSVGAVKALLLGPVGAAALSGLVRKAIGKLLHFSISHSKPYSSISLVLVVG